MLEARITGPSKSCAVLTLRHLLEGPKNTQPKPNSQLESDDGKKNWSRYSKWKNSDRLLTFMPMGTK